MRCPRCGHQEDKVTDSRSSQGGETIRRRRECLACGRRFTTSEDVRQTRLRVLKQDGRHEDLQREKLVRGIETACQKRPVNDEQIRLVVRDVLEELEDEFESVVSSREIGEKVMVKLRVLDPVAFVRFASVYWRFQDVKEFLTTIERINDA